MDSRAKLSMRQLIMFDMRNNAHETEMSYQGLAK